MTLPLVAAGAIVAALIAAAVSLLGLVIGKEQKTSEFRQAWIDALRTEIAKYISDVRAIHDGLSVPYEDSKARLAALSSLYSSFNASTLQIVLRLNPDEREPKIILGAMNRIQKAIGEHRGLSGEELQSTEAVIIASAQRLLKAEWGRVKSGEPVFRIASILLAGLAISSAIYLVLSGALSGGSALLTFSDDKEAAARSREGNPAESMLQSQQPPAIHSPP